MNTQRLECMPFDPTQAITLESMPIEQVSHRPSLKPKQLVLYQGSALFPAVMLTPVSTVQSISKPLGHAALTNNTNDRAFHTQYTNTTTSASPPLATVDHPFATAPVSTPASFFEDGALANSSILFSPISPVAVVSANIRSFRSLPDLTAWEQRLVTPSHVKSAGKNSSVRSSGQSYSHLDLPIPLSSIECNGLRAAVLATESNPVIARYYAPHTILGVGFNGIVLGASRLADNRSVAIKIIYKNLTRAYNMCIPNEIVLLRSFSHTNAIEYLDDFEDAFYFYLVTSVCDHPWSLVESFDRDDASVSNIKDKRSDEHELALSLQTLSLQPTKPTVFPHSRKSRWTPLECFSSNHSKHSSTYPVTLRCFSPSGGTPFILCYSRSSADLHAYLELMNASMSLSTPTSTAALHNTSQSVHSTPTEHATRIHGIFSQIANGLNALHSHGWTHGDIKQQNILVDSKMHAFLCDFGHAKPMIISPVSPTAQNNSVPCMSTLKSTPPHISCAGTLSMTPPELISNLDLPRSMFSNMSSSGFNSSLNDLGEIASTSGFTADVWALGMVLYSMMYFRFPNSHSAYLRGEIPLNQYYSFPCEFPTDADPQFCDLISKMLAINPDDRITMADVVHHPFLVSTQ
ncbi:hypothetical protein MT418_000978 [Batrachochytrium dendrobatidis]